MNTPAGDSKEKPPHVVVRGNANGFLQEVVSGRHHLQADEPAAAGGNDAAPGPYDYLLIALGVCTSMTVGFYARRKQIPLENIVVSLSHSRIHAKDCEECETKEGLLDRIDAAFRPRVERATFFIPYRDGPALALCYDKGRVLSRADEPEGIRVEVELPRRLVSQLDSYRRSE